MHQRSTVISFCGFHATLSVCSKGVTERRGFRGADMETSCAVVCFFPHPTCPFRVPTIRSVFLPSVIAQHR
jgi:hypothetical protein